MILNKIMNVDFEKYLKTIPDESIDFAFTDPPFSTNNNLELEEGFDPDKDIDCFFKELQRIMKKNTFVAFFGMQKIITKGKYKGLSSLTLWNLKAYENGFKFKQEVIWNKRNGFGLSSKIINIHENIHIFMKGAPSFQECRVDAYEYYKDYDVDSMVIKNITSSMKKLLNSEEDIEAWKQYKFHGNKDSIYSKNKKNHVSELDYNPKMLRVKSTIEGVKGVANGMIFKSIFSERPDTQKSLGKKKVGLGTHPTQKPIKLLKNIIKLCSQENDIILDPFMGTGSTAIACIDTKRKYIGCEIVERYYEHSEKRIEEHKGLFNGEKI